MKIHWSIKALYSLFVLVLVPFYFRHYGWENFLWFSDIAMLLLVPALWLESRLLASMMFLCAGVFDTIWIVDVLCALFFGFHVSGGTEYMFDPSEPLFLRNLSLFHVLVPMISLLMISRLGYEPRAIRYQTLVAWVVLPFSHFFTSKAANINWTHGPGFIVDWRYPLLWLGFVMLFIPLVYLVLDRLMMRFFVKPPHP